MIACASRLRDTAADLEIAAAEVAPIRIFTLSPGLRAEVQRLATEPEALVERVLDALREEIPDYEKLTDPAALRDVRASVGLNVRSWYRALLSGEGVARDDLREISEFALRRVHQGVSLAGYLHAYRVGSRTLWMRLVEEVEHTALGPELLRKVSPYLLEHFDTIAQAVGVAYTGEQQEQARWRDHLRHRLVDGIFESDLEPRVFERLCGDFGVEPQACLLALVASLGPPRPGRRTPTAVLDAVARDLAGELRMAPGRLVYAVRQGQLQLWAPVPEGSQRIEFGRRLHRHARQLMGRQPLIERLGIGLPGVGATGWRESARQARAALRSLDARAGVPVADYADILLEDPVAASGNAAAYLDSLLERLDQEAGLVATLEALFAGQSRRKAVAERLGVHPNTLTHRLDRIARILGLDLDHQQDLALLHTALRLRRRRALVPGPDPAL